MSKNDVDLKVKQTLARVLNVTLKQLSASSSQKTISSWDSLTHLKLIMELEKNFKIAFGTEEVFDIDTVEKISSSVSKHLS